MSYLLSADELHSLLTADDHAVRLIDVRWRLDKPDGRDDYRAGHLPGAVYVDLHHELARQGEPDEGRHPLPAHSALEQAVRSWGVDDGDIVVAYDDVKSLAAARAWWVLRRAGVDVRVLDGGLRAWSAKGYPLDTDDVTPTVGSATLTAAEGGELTIDEAAAFPENGVLLDVRASERYRGDVEPLDPIAGHIPGAINLPISGTLAPDGRVKDPSELTRLFTEAGVVPGTAIAAYCGSGITAANVALALSEVGIEASIFTGSWSQWSNTSGRQVAVGPTPADDIVGTTDGASE